MFKIIFIVLGIMLGFTSIACAQSRETFYDNHGRMMGWSEARPDGTYFYDKNGKMIQRSTNNNQVVPQQNYPQQNYAGPQMNLPSPEIIYITRDYVPPPAFPNGLVITTAYFDRDGHFIGYKQVSRTGGMRYLLFGE